MLKRLLFVLLALLLAVLVIGCGVNGDGAGKEPDNGAGEQTDPEPEKEWTVIASWEGNGIKKTETFTTLTKEWRLNWETSNENVAGVLQVMVYKAGKSGLMEDMLVNAMGVGSDTSYFRGDPGEYYLDINSANVSWKIEVEELR